MSHLSLVPNPKSLDLLTDDDGPDQYAHIGFLDSLKDSPGRLQLLEHHEVRFVLSKHPFGCHCAVQRGLCCRGWELTVRCRPCRNRLHVEKLSNAVVGYEPSAHCYWGEDDLCDDDDICAHRGCGSYADCDHHIHSPWLEAYYYGDDLDGPDRTLEDSEDYYDSEPYGDYDGEWETVDDSEHGSENGD